MNSITNPLDPQEKPTWPRRRPLHLTPRGFTQILKAEQRVDAMMRSAAQAVYDHETMDGDSPAPECHTPDESGTLSPEPWFQRLRKARAAFSDSSGGALELLSKTYRGDNCRHEVLHRTCERHSWISMRELQMLPENTWCPHCHSVDRLARFGSMEELQLSVYRESGHNAYFYSCNTLGTADQQYIFWCGHHRRPYEATFAEFQLTKGESNGCPLCRQEEKRGDTDIRGN